MSAPAPGFADDDDAAQHWLTVLRDGTDIEKIQARSALAVIFERRGLLTEATELLKTNAAAGATDAEASRKLADLYQASEQDEGNVGSQVPDGSRRRDATATLLMLVGWVVVAIVVGIGIYYLVVPWVYQ